MSTRSGAGNDAAELMTHWKRIYLGNHDRQTDADGRFFRSGEFVTPTATGNRSWRWKLLRSGDSLFNFCIESLSDRPVTLSSVALYVSRLFDRIVLTEKQNIGQPSYQSGDFSVANGLPGLDEKFRRNLDCEIRIVVQWTEAEVGATPVPMSSDDVLEGLYAKAMSGGDAMYELVSSDDQSFRVNVAILKAKSAYFERFFATEGWKEQTEGRMTLAWTSAVIKQLLRYVYLNKVDGDICEHLPDILDAAQMWELVGMKPLIEAQMSERLQKAARDADTAGEYLKMAHLHNLASLVPLCNKVLADNFDQFYASDVCKQMEQNETYRHLVKDVIDLRK